MAGGADCPRAGSRTVAPAVPSHADLVAPAALFGRHQPREPARHADHHPRDGKIWLASQDGTISIVSAKGDWEMIQVNTLDDEVFATPVPADGELFIRTRSALYNFGK